MAATQKAYNSREIDDVGWIRTGENIVDVFEKLDRNDGLKRMFDTELIGQSVAQWVLHGKYPTDQGPEEAKRTQKELLG